MVKGKDMRENKIKIKFEDIASLILLLYPLRKIAWGIDIMDAGYALGNYQNFEVMDQTWKLATYYANLFGRFLQWLPIGDTWIGMNIYTGILIGIAAAGTFRYLCQSWGSVKDFPVKHVLFIAELVALSLCWAPSVLLYHYGGYLFMTVTVLLLVRAIKRDKGWQFFIAGVILGSCVFVRMPNITYMAFILPVWYGAYLYWDKQWLEKGLRQTGYCIAGYMAGIVPPLLMIIVKYGWTAYPDMMKGLFGMTDTATDYKPTSMITAMLGDYGRYSIWLLLFVLYFIAGVILFNIKRGVWETVKKVLYCAGMLVLIRFCYGRGMFDFSYNTYFSMYKWITVYLLCVILLCIYLLVDKKAKREHKLWAGFLLTIIFITPLGSNNNLYPIMNNLFLAAPVSVYLLFQTAKPYYSFFPVKGMLLFLCTCVSVQSILFGCCFVFHETAQTGQEWVKADIPGTSKLRGMYTLGDKNAQLAELGQYLAENELLNKKVLLYGNIPAISYLFDLEPAIYTTWIDLASNPIDRMDLTIQNQEFPVVIVSQSAGGYLEKVLTGGESEQYLWENEKQRAIGTFLMEGQYQCVFKNQGYYVFWR